MSKQIWYLVGLALVAAACSPMLEPTIDGRSGSDAKSPPIVEQPGEDTTTYGWRGEGENKRRLF